ncbi:MAG TPA: hypothetical protein VHD37_00370 [Candidatus Paceibacterota bacterium]|nr:hypothetical protein [Candidatus Paceibacterota bacterium]
MKVPRNKTRRRGQNFKSLPLISSEIVLTPKQVADGCVVVDVPLTSLERQQLEDALARTGGDVKAVVRDALRIADITSEEEVLFGNQFMVRNPDTGEIRSTNFWPKKN